MSLQRSEARSTHLLKVFEKKACNCVVLQKDFAIDVESESVDLLLTEKDTRIGELINKPVDYWYEIELNPIHCPQTIIGYDDDGPKIFRLLPEGQDTEIPDTPEEEIPVVDLELDLTSTRPVQNQAITRAIRQLEDATTKHGKALENAGKHESNTSNPHNVTKTQVGLGNVPNVSTNNQTPTYTQASTLANLVSGEKLSVSFGKLMKGMADLISHLSNKSNPHGVTASQVGARPSNWMPTAAQIGARASTWMPTAADVGARPDTWMPTAADVGARPNTWTPSADDVGARPSSWTPSASDVGALSKNGDTMNGDLSMKGSINMNSGMLYNLAAPTSGTHATNKNYVDDAIADTHDNPTSKLTVAGWTGSDAPYTQVINVTGVTKDDNPHVTPVYSSTLETAKAEKEAWDMVTKGESGNGTITFSCFEEKPEVAIPIQIEVNR